MDLDSIFEFWKGAYYNPILVGNISSGPVHDTDDGLKSSLRDVITEPPSHRRNVVNFSKIPKIQYRPLNEYKDLVFGFSPDKTDSTIMEYIEENLSIVCGGYPSSIALSMACNPPILPTHFDFVNGYGYFYDIDHDHYIIDENHDKLEEALGMMVRCCKSGKYRLHMKYNKLNSDGTPKAGAPYTKADNGIDGPTRKSQLVGLSKITKFKRLPHSEEDPPSDLESEMGENSSERECMDISYLQVHGKYEKLTHQLKMEMIFRNYDLSTSCFAIEYVHTETPNPSTSCILYTIPYNYAQLSTWNNTPSNTQNQKDNQPKKLIGRKLEEHKTINDRIKKYIAKGWSDVIGMPLCFGGSDDKKT